MSTWQRWGGGVRAAWHGRAPPTHPPTHPPPTHPTPARPADPGHTCTCTCTLMYGFLVPPNRIRS